MPRIRRLARTPAVAPVLALVVAGACATASPAGADVEIPLDGAISPQYQGADPVAVADLADGVEPAVAIETNTSPEPPPTATPDPATDPGASEQYHSQSVPNKSESVSPSPGPVPAVPAVPPEPPEPPEPEPPEAPVPVAGPQPGELVPAEPPPALTDGPAGPIEPPLAPDAIGSPDAADPPATAAPGEPGASGNVNISIRIFSPGDNGPVVQTGPPDAGTGGAPPASTVPAPTTWIWNWNWNGAPACAPDGGGEAPPVGVEGRAWNWDWACAPPVLPGLVPAVGVLPDFDALPGVPALDPLALAVPGLPAIAPGTGAVVPAPGTGSRAARHGRGRPSDAWSSPTAYARPALLPKPGAQEPGAETVIAGRGAPERARGRHRARDTTRTPRAIPALSGAPMAPVAAASAAAAAGGVGSAPAVLATVICLLVFLQAGSLLAVAGLPRPRLRGARLERPG